MNRFSFYLEDINIIDFLKKVQAALKENGLDPLDEEAFRYQQDTAKDCVISHGMRVDITQRQGEFLEEISTCAGKKSKLHILYDLENSCGFFGLTHN